MYRRHKMAKLHFCRTQAFWTCQLYRTGAYATEYGHTLSMRPATVPMKCSSWKYCATALLSMQTRAEKPELLEAPWIRYLALMTLLP